MLFSAEDDEGGFFSFYKRASVAISSPVAMFIGKVAQPRTVAAQQHGGCFGDHFHRLFGADREC
jgi:hypothetical protein